MYQVFLSLRAYRDRWHLLVCHRRNTGRWRGLFNSRFLHWTVIELDLTVISKFPRLITKQIGWLDVLFLDLGLSGWRKEGVAG